MARIVFTPEQRAAIANGEIERIEARVRSTICETFNPEQGVIVEGRISQDDFDAITSFARTVNGELNHLRGLVASYEKSSDLLYDALGEAQEKTERMEKLSPNGILPDLRTAITQLEDAWARSDGSDTSGIDAARQAVASKLDALEGVRP